MTVSKSHILPDDCAKGDEQDASRVIWIPEDGYSVFAFASPWWLQSVVPFNVLKGGGILHMGDWGKIAASILCLNIIYFSGCQNAGHLSCTEYEHCAYFESCVSPSESRA